MGALYLKPLDDRMEKTGLYYARFMDDWVVIAPTRWKLRSAIRIVNETLNLLKVEQHPDWVYHNIYRYCTFTTYKQVHEAMPEAGLSFGTRHRAPTEQGADYLRIGEYVKHWLKWAKSGLARRVFWRE